MLLRQTEPADADHYISAVAMGSSPEHHPAQDTTTPRADPLDDVFGSDGGDDSPVFGSDDEHDGSQVHIIRGADHPSDVHRLRQEHTTAGYRDGITVAKASSVQAGFDEGFGLGATIGLKVGYLLGVLEGAAAGVPSSAAAAKLLADARAELGVRSVFSEEYWHPDGTWKYKVGAQDGAEAEEEDSEVLFSHVAEAHPAVSKWTAVVDGEMKRWGLQEKVPLLERREDEENGEAVARVNVKPVVQSQPDAKAASDALSW